MILDLPTFAQERRAGIHKYSDDQPRDDHGRWTTDGGVPPNVDIDYTGIDPALHGAVNRAARVFGERFPKIPLMIGIPPGRWDEGIAQAYTQGYAVRLNPEWFGAGAPARWADYEARDRRAHWSADPTPEGTIIHEAGHAVDWVVNEEGAKQFRGVPIDPAESGYARSQRDPLERFGEGFAEVMSLPSEQWSAGGRTVDAWLREPGIARFFGYVAKYSDSQPRDDHGRWTSDGGVPPEPGTVPLEPGMIRGYHYTNSIDSLHSILQTGLSTQYARGDTYGEPNQIWFSAQKPNGDSHAYVEAHFRPDELNVGGPWAGEKWSQQQIDDMMARGSNFTLMADHLPPDRIATYSEPWHSHYRYITENYPPAAATPDTIAEMRSVAQYDPDYGKAVDLWLTHTSAGKAALPFPGAERWLDVMDLLTKYSESQSREPAGSPEGGRFAGGSSEFSGGMKASDWPSGHVPGVVEWTRWATSLNPDNRSWSQRWSPEQQAQARDSLATVIREGQPAIRLPMSAFKQALADGVVKNQWETGRTQASAGTGTSYDASRRGGEQQYMGYPPDTPADQRPVYGYISSRVDGDFLHDDQVHEALGHLPINGLAPSSSGFDDRRASAAAAVEADPDRYYLAVVPRGSAGSPRGFVDSADSQVLRAEAADGKINTDYLEKAFRYYPLGDGSGGLNTTSIVGFANSEYGANNYGDVQVTLKRDILDNTTVTGGDSLDRGLMAVPARMAEAADPRIPIGMVSSSVTAQGLRDDYVETQYARHPTVDDFAAVTFTGTKPDRTTRDALDAAGVPWTYSPMTKLRGADWLRFSEVVA